MLVVVEEVLVLVILVLGMEYVEIRQCFMELTLSNEEFYH
jgi:hypothetical protein